MSLFAEQKRRDVFRVAIAYLAEWLLKSVVALLAVGWPIAMAVQPDPAQSCEPRK